MRVPFVFALFSFTAFLLAPSEGRAAPQILAALPAESGIALSCAEGTCAAQLSTYCLQRERPAPSMGTAYVPAKPEHFTLILTGENGHEVHLPAGAHMRFVENRGFMSVAATLEHGRMRALGATSARLAVRTGASLIPVPVAGDPDPLTEKEIAFVTDSLREYGQNLVDNTPKAASAQLLARLNAALPDAGVPAPSGGFQGIWQSAIGDELPVPSTSPAFSGAKEAYDDCAGRSRGMTISGFKRCLEFRHDDLIRSLNIEYWQNQPGT